MDHRQLITYSYCQSWVSWENLKLTFWFFIHGGNTRPEDQDHANSKWAKIKASPMILALLGIVQPRIGSPPGLRLILRVLTNKSYKKEWPLMGINLLIYIHFFYHNNKKRVLLAPTKRVVHLMSMIHTLTSHYQIKGHVRIATLTVFPLWIETAKTRNERQLKY